MCGAAVWRLCPRTPPFPRGPGAWFRSPGFFACTMDYVEKLVAALNHEIPYLRTRAAWLLGRCGDPRAVTPLIAALEANASDPYILQAVVLSLGQLGDRRAVASLVRLLGSSFLPVRVAAARALGMLGDPAAVPALEAALGDENSLVREAAAAALAQLKTSPVGRDGPAG